MADESIEHASGSRPRLHDLPVIGLIRLRRSCLNCDQPFGIEAVRREPRTNLLLIVCPACGAPEPVGYRDLSIRQLLSPTFTMLLYALWWFAVGIAGPVVIVLAYSLVHATVAGQFTYMPHSGGQRASFTPNNHAAELPYPQVATLSVALALIAWGMMSSLVRRVRPWIWALAVAAVISGAAGVAWAGIRMTLAEQPAFHSTVDASALWVIGPTVLVLAMVPLFTLLSRWLRAALPPEDAAPVDKTAPAERDAAQPAPAEPERDRLAAAAKPPAPPATRGRESNLAEQPRFQRVGQGHADKRCLKCGYSLATLPIAVEPNTGLHVVTCPECGSLMPVREGVPVGDRPSNALQRTATRVGVWILLVLAVFFLCCGSMIFSGW